MFYLLLAILQKKQEHVFFLKSKSNSCTRNRIPSAFPIAINGGWLLSAPNAANVNTEVGLGIKTLNLGGKSLFKGLS